LARPGPKRPKTTRKKELVENKNVFFGVRALVALNLKPAKGPAGS